MSKTFALRLFNSNMLRTTAHISFWVSCFRAASLDTLVRSQQHISFRSHRPNSRCKNFTAHKCTPLIRERSPALPNGKSNDTTLYLDFQKAPDLACLLRMTTIHTLYLLWCRRLRRTGTFFFLLTAFENKLYYGGFHSTRCTWSLRWAGGQHIGALFLIIGCKQRNFVLTSNTGHFSWP